jgi:hypothetical protein
MVAVIVHHEYLFTPATNPSLDLKPSLCPAERLECFGYLFKPNLESEPTATAASALLTLCRPGTLSAPGRDILLARRTVNEEPKPPRSNSISVAEISDWLCIP